MTDFIIIGSGHGGISISALLSKNYKVQLLESHYTIGGCAGFYKKHGSQFEVGATTLSGMAHNGPLKRLLNHLDIQLDLVHCSPAMSIHLSSEHKITRFNDNEEWISELERVFPKIEQREFWNKLSQINQLAYSLLPSIKNFPPKSFKDFLSLLNPKILKALPLAPYLFIPLEKLMSKEMLSSESFRRFIDEQLLISAGVKSNDVSVLIGAMSLCYPEDTYYPVGGINQLAQKLAKHIKSNGSEVLTRTRVRNIELIDNHYKVTTTDDQIYLAKNVISNIPFWNLKSIVKERELLQYFDKLSNRFESSWGAICLYANFETQNPVEELYQQIHYQGNHRLLKNGSLFFSFSKSNDRKRNKEGLQCMTVSTHVNVDEFEDMDIEKYSELKEELSREILKVFQENILKDSTIKFYELGTPKTFEHYTGRYRGYVGGLAHSFLRSPFFYPSQSTPLKNFYLVGDTTFPGQGIVGVVQGALNLYNRITKENV